MGATVQDTRQEAVAINVYGYTNDDLLENIAAGTDYSILSSTYSQYRYGSVYAKVKLYV